MRPRARHHAWRTFRPWHRRQIEVQLVQRHEVWCPYCGRILEAQPGTRLSAVLQGARGYDLDCRSCRRFHPVVRHTSHSLRSLRVRRFAAAVKRA